jgi:hypothetical protein
MLSCQLLVRFQGCEWEDGLGRDFALRMALVWLRGVRPR